MLNKKQREYFLQESKDTEKQYHNIIKGIDKIGEPFKYDNSTKIYYRARLDTLREFKKVFNL